ncbi:hypothetical protein BRARA_F01628 [Brassica rapa]|uniref:Uncharacterized protein n=1 Tax=Brassica campestris TaxID=3711 RepID=A0A397YXY3_BRACM|nr:hypothetical protein BRARA_F01628 [Brassica rapa]
MRTALRASKEDTKRIVKSVYNVLQLLSVCPVRLIGLHYFQWAKLNYLSLCLCLHFHWFIIYLGFGRITGK